MQISYVELSQRAKLSKSFACQILNGAREPSLPKAFQIYDATGLQFGLLKGLDRKTIESLRPKAAA
jgi:transcriptional regulator with XRE-family HTH domain